MREERDSFSLLENYQLGFWPGVQTSPEARWKRCGAGGGVSSSKGEETRSRFFAINNNIKNNNKRSPLSTSASAASLRPGRWGMGARVPKRRRAALRPPGRGPSRPCSLFFFPFPFSFFFSFSLFSCNSFSVRFFFSFFLFPLFPPPPSPGPLLPARAPFSR